MHHIDHIDSARHSYRYHIKVTGRSEFDVIVHDFTTANAEKHLDGILKSQDIPFACATLVESTDPRAKGASRALHVNDNLDEA